MEQTSDISELAKALSKAQGEVKGAIKDSVNPHFKSSYADLESVWDACRQALSSNGLAVTQFLESVGSESAITTTLMHTSGQWQRSTILMKPKSTDPQGVGSAITYYRRYALAAAIGINQTDDDGEASYNRQKPLPKPNVIPNIIPNPTSNGSSSKISEKQRNLIWARLKNDLKLSDESARDFLKAATGKESSKDWTRTDFDAALAAIDTKYKRIQIENGVVFPNETDQVFTDEEMWDEERH